MAVFRMRDGRIVTTKAKVNTEQLELALVHRAMKSKRLTATAMRGAVKVVVVAIEEPKAGDA